MSLNRFAKRRDFNEKKIIKALESVGCSVYRLDTPCDLLCHKRRTFLIEVKDGSKSPSRIRKTDAQEKFFDWWPGEKYVCKSIDEALEAANGS